MSDYKETDSGRKRKYCIMLPANFNEILISWEMKFEKGDRDIETIRNILYMYSVSKLIIMK